MNDNIKEAIWVANNLFLRNKVSGSTANLSFYIDDKMYITGSGTCFGRLNEKSFSIIKEGQLLNDILPSKEEPLHEALYKVNENTKCVIHTHSSFATYWSCELDNRKEVKIPTSTPYLAMKVGKIVMVPYAKPGSEELFSNFNESVEPTVSAYLLKNHGVIVGGPSILEAFYMLEEIEEACKNAWMMKIGSSKIK